MKIAQDINVDNVTITISTDSTGTPKLNSNVLFTDKELTVPPSQIQLLLFRQLANSNNVMVCTGFQYGNEWYGDRPDNGAYRNPFTNTVEYVGEKPVLKPKVVVQETWQGIQLSFIGVPQNVANIYKTLNNVSWNIQSNDESLIGLENSSEIDSAVDIHFQSTKTIVSYVDEFNLTFTTSNSGNVSITLPKVKDTSGLGTFEVSGDAFESLFNA